MLLCVIKELQHTDHYSDNEQLVVLVLWSWTFWFSLHILKLTIKMLIYIFLSLCFSLATNTLWKRRMKPVSKENPRNHFQKTFQEVPKLLKWFQQFNMIYLNGKNEPQKYFSNTILHSSFSKEYYSQLLLPWQECVPSRGRLGKMREPRGEQRQ